MKKLLFTFVFLLSSLVGNAQTFKLGDVNKDGQVTIADVMMVVDIVMNGYKPLTLSSENVVVEYGSLATVNISSGYGPYDITCSDGNLVEVSLDGTQLSITGKAVGTAVVTVTDTSTGYTKDINVTVNAEPLTISNNTVEVTAGESATVEITSGSGNYSVKSSDPSVATATVSNGIVTITSVAGGTATIIVTDTQSGQTATIEVTVAYLPLALSSSSVSLIVGDEGTVEITSGSGSYSVGSSDDNVVFAELDGNTVSILAFGVGSATITVTDTQSGQTATIEVTVDYLPLELSASSLTLTVGEESTVNITSGSGNYSIENSDISVATVSLSSTSIKVTAVAAGTAIITVTDTKSGQTATIEVTVNENQTASLCPDDHHPHLIDLGLPSGTKWACCNVDTDHPENQSPTNYGGYYAWGETETKSNYGESTHQYYKNGSYQSLGSSISGTKYDVAHVKWGGSWVMPSKEQIDELERYCTYEWTTMNGVYGGKYTNKSNGNSIFFPAAGCHNYSFLYEDGSVGYFWSSTQDPLESDRAYCLLFYSDGAGWSGDTFRSWGRSVRPVVSRPQSYLTCPDGHHPHLIDLGLPSGTKWACCNVDTDHPENQSPTNYGGYYAWGETETKSLYYENSYIHCDGSYNTYYDLGSDISGTVYDVAHVKWGGYWVMPSHEQQEELISHCTFEWTTVNGVNGGKFTNYITGGSIFLPAAGIRFGKDLEDVGGSDGSYWSSTHNTSYSSTAYNLFFGSDSADSDWGCTYRYYGRSVRPVVRN